MFREEAPGVFSVESRFVDGKNGVVVGRRGVLAVDGSNFPDEGQAMVEEDRLMFSGDSVVTGIVPALRMGYPASGLSDYALEMEAFADYVTDGVVGPTSERSGGAWRSSRRATSRPGAASRCIWRHGSASCRRSVKPGVRWIACKI